MRNIEKIFFFSNVSFCVWNVGGYISKDYNKLTDRTFLEEIVKYEIILLTETHIGYNTSVNIDGYLYYPICRPISRNYRYYGGLGILIMKDIRKGVKILQNTSQDYQWIKLEKNYFNFTKDIFLCLAYIIPSNSFYANQSTDEVLENIESDIVNKYSGKGNIILCGDLNARTGSVRFLVRDSFVV